MRCYGFEILGGLDLRLCQKCVDAIFDICKENPHLILIKNKQKIVSESKCEFWAHNELNRINKARVADCNSDFKKQGRMGIGPID